MSQGNCSNTMSSQHDVLAADGFFNSNRPSNAVYGNRLFDRGIFSDCKIQCKGRSWDLHRSMLAPRCEFFRASFTSGFQESIPHSRDSTSQFQEVSISMQDDDPEALDRMLRWIYTFSYPSLIGEEQSPSPTDPVSLPALFWTSELRLCAIADKYDLTYLLDDAALSILDACRYYISDPSSQQHCETFLCNLGNFVDMLEMLFTDLESSNLTLPFKLESDILEITADMIAKFIGQEEKLFELMSNIPSFGVMLVQVLSRQDESDSEGQQEVRSSSRSTSSVSDTGSVHSRRLPRGSTSDSSTSRSSDVDVQHRARRAVRGEGKRTRNRKQIQPEEGSTGRVEKIHIPMNEDSDLD